MLTQRALRFTAVDLSKGPAGCAHHSIPRHTARPQSPINLSRPIKGGHQAPARNKARRGTGILLNVMRHKGAFSSLAQKQHQGDDKHMDSKQIVLGISILPEFYRTCVDHG